MTQPPRRQWRTILWSVAVLYSALHFWYSGIHQPWSKPFTKERALLQIQERIQPLVEHTLEGVPVHSIGPEPQYGPVFFFLMHPVLLFCGENFPLLCQWVYWMGLTSLFVAFVFCTFSMQFWLNETYGPRSLSSPHLALLLGVLWANFSPMYSILSAGVPEMWELALMSAALSSYLRGRRFLASLALVAAALIKILPAVLLLYFVCRDRRTLWYSILSAGLLLSISQCFYGWQMGYGYVWAVIKTMFGATYVMTWHENVSLKGMIVKLFAGFTIRPSAYATVIDDRTLFLANVIAHLAQLAGIAWTAWVLTRTLPAKHSCGIVWGWSWLSAMAMLLAPAIAFEYMTLSLLAFSAVLAAFVVDPELRRHRLALICFGVAVFLVANIVPRQMINHLLPIAAITRLGGTTHLTLSEAYQYYGFPFLGMLSFLMAIWLIRRRVVTA